MSYQQKKSPPSIVLPDLTPKSKHHGASSDTYGVYVFAFAYCNAYAILSMLLVNFPTNASPDPRRARSIWTSPASLQPSSSRASSSLSILL
eukprot:906072-Amorphochlora_amoeboformis.AAC.1